MGMGELFILPQFQTGRVFKFTMIVATAVLANVVLNMDDHCPWMSKVDPETKNYHFCSFNIKLTLILNVLE